MVALRLVASSGECRQIGGQIYVIGVGSLLREGEFVRVELVQLFAPLLCGSKYMKRHAALCSIGFEYLYNWANIALSDGLHISVLIRLQTESDEHKPAIFGYLAMIRILPAVYVSKA